MRVVKLPPETGEFPAITGLPLISAAVDEVEMNIKAPRALVFSSALSVVSVVLQGLYDVKKPKGGVAPCSLMLLMVANSGERKSSVEKVFMSPVHSFQSRKLEEYEKIYAEWEVAVKLWGVKNKVIEKAYSKCIAKGLSSESFERQSHEHAQNKPKYPKKFKMLYDDSSSAGLFRGINDDLSTAGLITSEGVGVLKGSALNDLSKQNSLWSGDSITVDRANAKTIHIAGGRLTVSIMVQPKVFENFKGGLGVASRGAGLLARFLVCQPESTQGSRIDNGDVVYTEHAERFSARVSGLLKRNYRLLETNPPVRECITFSSEAAEHWLAVSNAIELKIKNGRFKDAGDHASKLADNIARLAALFHCFEGFSGEIALQTLKVAIDVGFWYSGEFLRLFDSTDEEEKDVNELVRWLIGHYWDYSPVVGKRFVMQHGPNRLRKKAQLDKVLSLLVERGALSLVFGSCSLIDLQPVGKMGILNYVKRGRVEERRF